MVPILVWIAWLVGLAYAADSVSLAAIAVATAAIALLGLADDMFSLPIGVRIVAQVLICSGWLGALVAMRVAPLDPLLLALALLALLWLLNSYNFMDGIDGLATWEGIFVAAGLAWILGGGPIGHAALGLTAALAGFLPWNWPRARIFLGDVGSTAIGFGLGALALLGFWQASLAPALPVLLLAVFMVDAAATLALRVWRRERWYTPHRRHTYQVLVAGGKSHGEVVAIYMGVNLLLIVPAGWAAVHSVEIQAPTVIGVYLILFIAWLLARR
ncbi:MAG: hypothetical protein R3202_09205 [Candidatus Competibacterales bacterium]|nr:hypothetical protein [Candidatus Competibacterales bacterium]